MHEYIIINKADNAVYVIQPKDSRLYDTLIPTPNE